MPFPPPRSPAATVVGGVCGIVGGWQALEAVKCLLGIGVLLTDRMMLFDGRTGTIEEVAVGRNPDCLCGKGGR